MELKSLSNGKRVIKFIDSKHVGLLNSFLLPTNKHLFLAANLFIFNLKHFPYI